MTDRVDRMQDILDRLLTRLYRANAETKRLSDDVARASIPLMLFGRIHGNSKISQSAIDLLDSSAGVSDVLHLLMRDICELMEAHRDDLQDVSDMLEALDD